MAAKAQQMIGADPFSGHLFIFRGKQGDYFKGLYWDGSGLWLIAKRLEKGRFVTMSLATADLPEDIAAQRAFALACQGELRAAQLAVLGNMTATGLEQTFKTARCRTTYTENYVERSKDLAALHAERGA